MSVIGVPDAHRGETPKAFVKVKAGAPAPTFDEMKASRIVSASTTTWAMELRDELPKTWSVRFLRRTFAPRRTGEFGLKSWTTIAGQG